MEKGEAWREDEWVQHGLFSAEAVVTPLLYGGPREDEAGGEPGPKPGTGARTFTTERDEGKNATQEWVMLT